MSDQFIDRPLSELPDTVSFGADWSKDWSYGKHGYADYVIEHTAESEPGHFVITRYKLPKTLGQMIECERRSSKEDAQRDVRMALGLD